jgi:hypothetical protein
LPRIPQQGATEAATARTEIDRKTREHHHRHGIRHVAAHGRGRIAASHRTRRDGGYADTAVVEVAPGLVRCALDGGVVWVGTAAALNAHFGDAIEHSPGDAPRAVGFGVTPDRVYWV